MSSRLSVSRRYSKKEKVQAAVTRRAAEEEKKEKGVFPPLAWSVVFFRMSLLGLFVDYPCCRKMME
jgi:hypothetical protein